MDITQEKIEEQNALLKVVVTPEDYNEKYKQTLKEYGKQINMPGFRPGKVPVSLVKSKYGKALLMEEIERLVSEKINAYVTENELPLIGGIVPSAEKEMQGNWDNPENFEFYYEIGLKPELEVALTKKDKLTYYTIALEDKRVDEEVERIARRYGKLSNAEEVEKNDLLLGDFVELDDKDEVVPGGIMNNNSITLESLDDETQELFVGKKPGDEVIVDPLKMVRDREELERLLEISPEAVDAIDGNFKFIIREIKRLQPADFDEELFDKVFGDDVVQTEEEFREKVAESLRERFESESDTMFRRDLSNHLIEKYQPTLPDEFLKKWLRTNEEMDIDVEQEYDEYRRSTQWQLIVNSLIESKEIQMDENDIIEKTKELLREQFVRYGMPDPDEEQLVGSARQVLSNQEEANKISNLLVNEKLITYAKEQAKVTEKEVDFDKFAELAAQDPAEKATA